MRFNEDFATIFTVLLDIARVCLEWKNKNWFLKSLGDAEFEDKLTGFHGELTDDI